jgi:hypothetical protein
MINSSLRALVDLQAKAFFIFGNRAGAKGYCQCIRLEEVGRVAAP